jgi:citrate lyase beta subunit
VEGLERDGQETALTAEGDAFDALASILTPSNETQYWAGVVNTAKKKKERKMAGSKMSFVETVGHLLEENEIVQDHIALILDLEDLAEVFGATLPHRVLSDRENPLECLRPREFR